MIVLWPAWPATPGETLLWIERAREMGMGIDSLEGSEHQDPVPEEPLSVRLWRFNLENKLKNDIQFMPSFCLGVSRGRLSTLASDLPHF